MSELKWDELIAREYEVGLDRGVLYPGDGRPGVPWNGLVSVVAEKTGSEIKPLYLDGLKYENRRTPAEFSATIEAFTYPDEFANIVGESTSGSGLYFGQQKAKEFGLAYRTLVGNAASGSEPHYKIHLIYNAMADPGTLTSGTKSQQVDPNNMSWVVDTRGVRISGRAPSAELVVDSRQAEETRLQKLERWLYGTETTAPFLPSINQVVTLFDDWPRLQINQDTAFGLNPLTYKGFHDLTGDNAVGLYTAPKETRLKPTTIEGLYRI